MALIVIHTSLDWLCGFRKKNRMVNYGSHWWAELFADYWSKISQEYEPLNISTLPPCIKSELSKLYTIPILEEYYVHRKIVQARKPNGTVPGDLPPKVVKQFPVELSIPATILYNKSLQSGQYPRQWIVEHANPIPKTLPPTSEECLRLISVTPFLSKVYESILGDWVLLIVDPYLDPSQCGGLRGSSTSHYLIRILQFIHSNLDKPQPHAVIMACIDLEKAFLRVSHQHVIQDLYDMHVPGWLLNIFVSYLTNRPLKVRYKGATSTSRSMPGSTPQGCFWGNFLFCIKFNGALLCPAIPRPLSSAPQIHQKFIDDALKCAVVNLKTDLKPNPVVRPFPLSYSERTCQILDPQKNVMQLCLNDLKYFTDKKPDAYKWAKNSDCSI